MTNAITSRWPEALGSRMIEAATWCGERVRLSNPRGCLRSVELRPLHGEIINAGTVERIVQLRRRLIDQAVEVNALDGRLLLWFPDGTLSDGAAEVETDGYLDVDNQPPWDTWIAWGDAPKIPDLSCRKFVVSWVPPEFLGLIERGVDVNPERCIQWLDRDFTMVLPTSGRRVSLGRFRGRFSWGERIPIRVRK